MRGSQCCASMTPPHPSPTQLPPAQGKEPTSPGQAKLAPGTGPRLSQVCDTPEKIKQTPSTPEKIKQSPFLSPSPAMDGPAQQNQLFPRLAQLQEWIRCLQAEDGAGKALGWEEKFHFLPQHCPCALHPRLGQGGFVQVRSFRHFRNYPHLCWG